MRLEFSMKNTLLITIISLLLFSCDSKIDNSFYIDLVYPAKEVVEKTYTAENKYEEILQGKLISHIKYVYSHNEGSKMSEFSHFNATDGHLYKYLRRDNGNEHSFYLTSNDTVFNDKTLISEEGKLRIYIITGSSRTFTHTDTIWETLDDNILTIQMGTRTRYILELKNGRTIRWVNYENNSIDHEICFKYNRKGFIIEEVKHSTITKDTKDIKVTTRSTYEYPEIDNKDNWIKKITYKDGEIESITTRDIIY
ncbi:MAG: hypothetical protein GX963_11400 [Bacteroidales bacterium]|nr:hypothetical protein [Bacteroidales bacterium]